MPDIWLDVDTALSEVPINKMPLIDDGDFKSREESVAYNQAGLDLLWNFVTTAGVFTQTAVTPTNTGGDYDFVNQGNGLYTIEIPATDPGGGSIWNDTEGFGYFSGFATGVLPWIGPIIGFRAAALNNALIDGGDNLQVDVTHIMNTILTEGGGGRLAAAFIKLFDVASPVLVASDVMVGTANAATAANLAIVAGYIDTEIGTLLTRLSAARAGYLDNLSAGAVALASGVNVTSEANIDFGALKKTSLNAATPDLSAITGDKDSYKATGFALASVVGALADAAAAGDPTSSDTLMKYVKQLINILIGTAGIGTFPSESAPGNAVSLAEVIRAIYEDSNAIQGKLPTNKFMGSSDGADDNGTLDTINTNAARLTAARAAVLSDWINNGRLDLLLDAIKVVTDLLADSATTLISGTVSYDNTNATTTVFYCDDITEATADHYQGREVIFLTAALFRQATDITAYALVSGEGKFTVTALTEPPPDNCTFVIV